MTTIRVYFAENTTYAYIERSETTLDYVRSLTCCDGMYLASTREDYLALRPFKVCKNHTTSK